MQLTIQKKPKNPIIIEGFPGYGLVGTIATEFLIKHLNATQIGSIRIEEIPPVIAVHKGDPVEPLGIFYDPKHNFIILHALASVQGFEWKIADLLVKLANDLNAKEFISLEGVGANEITKEPRLFYLNKGGKSFKDSHIQPLKEGIIIGVTGALLLKQGLKLTCLFAETHSALPDSRAAAKIIEFLDEYLTLNVDFKPLIKKAEEFEVKIKDLINKSKPVDQSLPKKPAYFG